MKRLFRIRIGMIEQRWDDIKEDKSKEDIDFVVSWLDDLSKTLKKYERDREFLKEVIGSAHKFYLNELTDNQKTDAFAYLLGKFVRKM